MQFGERKLAAEGGEDLTAREAVKEQNAVDLWSFCDYDENGERGQEVGENRREEEGN